MVMLVHVNGSMFLPQVAEQDIYNADGQQQKDIDTVMEYVNEAVMGNHEKEPVDKDNDEGQNFHLVKIVDYYFEIDDTPLKHKPFATTTKNGSCFFSEKKILSVSLEIIAPPPKG